MYHRTLLILLVALCVAIPSMAQETFAVDLTWVDTKNPATTTYKVYEAPGDCTGTPTFVEIGTATSKTYTVNDVPPGSHCYAVTAVLAELESAKSDPVAVPIGPHKPETLEWVIRAVITMSKQAPK